MQENSKTRIGSIAIKLGFITDQQLDECVTIQKHMEGIGVKELLGHIMLKKNYLNKEQLQYVLRAAGLYKEIIPGYEIISKIGAGGMGIVYKARHIATDRLTALKVLSPKLARDEEYVKRFIREAKLASSITHPNIVLTYDVGENEGRYYIAMEFIDGDTLRHLMTTKGPMGEEEATMLLKDVASALDEVSKKGMVHRDIKPENIMLTRTGVTKLCDFGLAKTTDNPELSLTQTGLTLGTPYYMSPEQIREEVLDNRSDIYSLGATYFHLITGVPPFDAETPSGVLAKHLTEMPPSPKSIRPEISDAASAVCLRMLEKAKEDRYQSAKELIEDFNCILDGKLPVHVTVDVNTITETIRFIKRRTRTLPKPARFALAGASAFLVMLFAYAASGGGDDAAGSNNISGNTTTTTSSGKNDAVAPANNDHADSNDSTDDNTKPPDRYDAMALFMKRRDAEARGLFQDAKALHASGQYQGAKDKLEILMRLRRYNTTPFVKANLAGIRKLYGDASKLMAENAKDADIVYKNLRVMYETKNFAGFEDEYKKALDMWVCYTNEEKGHLKTWNGKLIAFKEYKVKRRQAITDFNNGEYSDLLMSRLTKLAQGEFYSFLDNAEQTEISRCRNELDKELRVIRILANVRVSAQTRNMTALAENLARLEQFTETNTYKRHSDEIAGYKDQLIKAKKRELESAEFTAKTLLDQAKKADESKDYKDALGYYKRLLDEYSKTETYIKNSRFIGDRIRDVTKTMEEMEGEACKLFEKIQKSYKSRDWGKCSKLLDEMKPYGATELYESKSPEIRRMRNTVLYYTSSIDILDMPDVSGYWRVWVTNNDAYKFVFDQPKLVIDKRNAELNLVVRRKIDNIPHAIDGRDLLSSAILLYTLMPKPLEERPQTFSITLPKEEKHKQLLKLFERTGVKFGYIPAKPKAQDIVFIDYVRPSEEWKPGMKDPEIVVTDEFVSLTSSIKGVRPFDRMPDIPKRILKNGLFVVFIPVGPLLRLKRMDTFIMRVRRISLNVLPKAELDKIKPDVDELK